MNYKKEPKRLNILRTEKKIKKGEQKLWAPFSLSGVNGRSGLDQHKHIFFFVRHKHIKRTGIKAGKKIKGSFNYGSFNLDVIMTKKNNLKRTKLTI